MLCSPLWPRCEARCATKGSPARGRVGCAPSQSGLFDLRHGHDRRSVDPRRNARSAPRNLHFPVHRWIYADLCLVAGKNLDSTRCIWQPAPNIQLVVDCSVYDGDLVFCTLSIRPYTVEQEFRLARFAIEKDDTRGGGIVPPGPNQAK